MPGRILVAYASHYGATREVAQVIGQVLSSGWGTVDLRPVQAVGELTPYRAVVLGSSVYGGALVPEAVDFVREYREELAARQVAYFLLSTKLRTNTPRHRRAAMACFDALREAAPEVTPVSVECFGGKVDFASLSAVERVAAWFMPAMTGDWRNWAAIRGWASALRTELLPDRGWVQRPAAEASGAP